MCVHMISHIQYINKLIIKNAYCIHFVLNLWQGRNPKCHIDEISISIIDLVGLANILLIKKLCIKNLTY